MRQAGILAAAGLYALEHNVDRLKEDHANAATLAEGLRQVEAFAPNNPQTNIVLVDLRSGTVDGWLAALKEAGVLATPFGARRLRMVTHLDVSAADIEEALRRIAAAAGKVAA